MSFSLDKKGIDYAKPGTINFRLGGKQFSMSISEFRVALGLYSPTYVETDRYLDSHSLGSNSRAHQFWRSHARVGSRDNYQPTKSKSTNLTSPILRVLHRFIAHTICGRRKSTGVVTM